MKHFDADRLREYKFGLLSEAEAAGVAAHLESCGECRAKFQTLEAQFQALDVLRDQPEVSKERLEAVLVEGRRSEVEGRKSEVEGRKSTVESRRSEVEGRRSKVGRSKVVLFRPVSIITAAAAGMAIAFMLLRPDLRPDERTAGGPPALSVVDEEKQALPRPAVGKERTTQRSSLRNSTAGGPPAAAESRLKAGEPIALEELRAAQPFAPASNIELNVLPRRDAVQITIYNKEDLTLVREKRRLTLKRGWNWLQYMWSNTLIDPTSLELEPKTNGDKIEITQLVYPPRLNALARWTIFSEFSGEADFELTYFTSGLKWNAFYEATLGPDEQTMALKSFVRVDNGSGEDYENAQTRLVVGDINLMEPIARLAQQNYTTLRRRGNDKAMSDVDFAWNADGLGRVGYDDLSFGLGTGLAVAGQQLKRIEKTGLSEYFLYTIEGKETIPNGWGKRLPSFDVQEIGVTNLYKYDEERWGRRTMRFLSFANTKVCKLGETPLPNGRVRVFGNVDAASSRVDLGDKASGSAHNGQGFGQGRSLTQNGAGSSVYVGASDIKYIPVGEKADLEIGVADKVMVEPKLMRTRTENYEFDRKGNISGRDEITDWTIELTNARDLPVTLEITRATGSSHWKVSTDAAYEKYDADHLKFTIELPPRSRQEIKYELTVRHGTRQETND